MKKIKYQLLQSVVDGNPVTLAKAVDYSESAEEIAKAEAYNGEYEIFDDGQPEPEAQATTDDVLNALLGVMV